MGAKMSRVLVFTIGLFSICCGPKPSAELPTERSRPETDTPEAPIPIELVVPSAAPGPAEPATSTEAAERLQGTEVRTILVNGGSVQAVAPRGWVHLFDRSNDEFVVFQIKNPADEGTPDSANASIRSLARWTSVEAAMNETVGTLLNVPGTVIVSNDQGVGKKRVILARGQLAQTPYVMIIVIGMRDNIVVVCQAAWPLLDATTPEWSDAMLRDYKSLLSSVHANGSQVFPGKDPTATDQQ